MSRFVSDTREGVNKVASVEKTSRLLTFVILFAVAAILAVVLMTSEIEGPGSAQLQGASAAAGGAAVARSMSQGLTLTALLTNAAYGVVAFVAMALLFQLGIRVEWLMRPPSSRLGVVPNAGRRSLLVGFGGVAILTAFWSLRMRAPVVAAGTASPAVALSTPVPVAPVSEVAEVVAPATPAPPPATIAMPTVPATVPTVVAAVPTVAPTEPAYAAAAPAGSPVAYADAYPTTAPMTAPATTVASVPNAVAPTQVAVASPPVIASAPAPTNIATSAPAPAVKPAAPVVSCQPPQTMPGGNNNYNVGGAPMPMVKNLGTGFLITGSVRDASNCQPLSGLRLQIWLNTERGGERIPSNRASVLTDEKGHYQLETSPVSPQFGQPHVHIAYDDGKFNTLFLRPVLKSEDDPSINVDIALAPRGVA